MAPEGASSQTRASSSLLTLILVPPSTSFLFSLLFPARRRRSLASWRHIYAGFLGVPFPAPDRGTSVAKTKQANVFSLTCTLASCSTCAAEARIPASSSGARCTNLADQVMATMTMRIPDMHLALGEPRRAASPDWAGFGQI